MIINWTWMTLIHIQIFLFAIATIEGKLPCLQRSGIRPQENKSLIAVKSIGAKIILPPHEQNKRKVFRWVPDSVKNAVSSGLATILAKSILQPLDTIKTIQQIQTVRKGVLETAKEIILLRGISGLWSGTIISAFGSAPAAAVYYGIFSSVKKHLAPLLPLRYRFLAVATAASISNTIASVFRVPYEVYKQRLQAGHHRTILEAVRYSWQKEGIIGLFQNGKLTSQIIRDVPYAIITAVIYDILQILLNRFRANQLIVTLDCEGNKRKVGYYQLQDAFCGATAGGLSAFLTTPMDMIKTRLMTGTNNYQSFLDAMRRIATEEGLATFFSGSASRVLHKIPANALFFAFYEALRYTVGAVEERSEQ